MDTFKVCHPSIFLFNFIQQGVKSCCVKTDDSLNLKQCNLCQKTHNYKILFTDSYWDEI